MACSTQKTAAKQVIHPAAGGGPRVAAGRRSRTMKRIEMIIYVVIAIPNLPLLGADSPNR